MLLAYARKLRFPQLFLLTGAVFFADLIIPDMLPFADEALLGLATLLLASLKDKRQKPEETDLAAVDGEVVGESGKRQSKS